VCWPLLGYTPLCFLGVLATWSAHSPTTAFSGDKKIWPYTLQKCSNFSNLKDFATAQPKGHIEQFVWWNSCFSPRSFLKFFLASLETYTYLAWLLTVSAQKPKSTKMFGCDMDAIKGYHEKHKRRPKDAGIWPHFVLENAGLGCPFFSRFLGFVLRPAHMRLILTASQIMKR